MEEVHVIRMPELSVSKEEVLRMLDCGRECNSYEVVSGIYEEVLDEAMGLLNPIILYKFGRIPTGYSGLAELVGKEVIYSIVSVGGKIAARSTEAFGQGDPMTGMLVSAIADSALFGMEKSLRDALKTECAVRRRGIAKRLEAPETVPMEVQKLIYHETEAEKIYHMKISSGYMLEPVKSSAVLFVLTEDATVFQAQHECRFCHNINCPARNGGLYIPRPQRNL